MTYEEWKQTRRMFLKFATTSTAYATAAVTIALKTDASARAEQVRTSGIRGNGQDGMPYPYMNP